MKPSPNSYRTTDSQGRVLDLDITTTGAGSAIGPWTWDGDTLVHSKLNLTASFDTDGPGTMRYVFGSPTQTVVATYAAK